MDELLKYLSELYGYDFIINDYEIYTCKNHKKYIIKAGYLYEFVIYISFDKTKAIVYKYDLGQKQMLDHKYLIYNDGWVNIET